MGPLLSAARSEYKEKAGGRGDGAFFALSTRALTESQPRKRARTQHRAAVAVRRFTTAYGVDNGLLGSIAIKTIRIDLSAVVSRYDTKGAAA